MANQFPISIHDAGKGAQGELIACAWLLGLGYEVFRNVAAAGPADLMAWNPETGETQFIDVKTVAERTVYRRSDGLLGFPLGRKARFNVHKLVVIGGRIAGFFRGQEGYLERYWPLPCDEIVFEIDAPSYKESRINPATGTKWRRVSMAERNLAIVG